MLISYDLVLIALLFTIAKMFKIEEFGIILKSIYPFSLHFDAARQ